jgi:hypothetical protein
MHAAFLKTAPALSRFSRELVFEENLIKRLMGERRANATMFSQQPRSGSRWEKESQRAIFSIDFGFGDVAD